MKNKILLTAIVALALIAFTANAAPWAHRYNDVAADGQDWQGTNVVQNSTLRVAVEWGEGDWDGAMGSAVGVGTTLDGSGWTWYELPWFENGGGSNKRCTNWVQFTTMGSNFWAYRIIKAANGGTNFHNGSTDWSETYSPLSVDPDETFVYVTPEPASIFLILLGLGLMKFRK